MLNQRQTYVPWFLSSSLCKSKPYGKLILHSIIAMRSICQTNDSEPGDPGCESFLLLVKLFYERMMRNFTEKKQKQIEADVKKPFQTILLLGKSDYVPVHKMMKGSDIGFKRKRIKNQEWVISATQNVGDQVSFLKDDFKKEESRNIDREIALEKRIKQQDNIVFKRDHVDPKPRSIPYLVKKVKSMKRYNYEMLSSTNSVLAVLSMKTLIPNSNVVAARAKGNGNGNNKNQIRCYNCRGMGRLARNYIVRPRRRDAAYFQRDLDEIKEVNANCILMTNLQQALISGTQSDKAPVYDSDGSPEVHEYDHCYNNEIFNMFTQKEQYTELLEPISEPHQVQKNDSNVISIVSSVKQYGGTVEQNPATVKETHAYFESLYNNLAIEVEKVNTVNRKMK
ncbi:hypothetical protein Tco_0221365 [Tanacetum coccineum]